MKKTMPRSKTHGSLNAMCESYGARSYARLLGYAASQSSFAITVKALAALGSTLTANTYPTEAAARDLINPRREFTTEEDVFVGGDLWGQNPLPNLPAVSLPDRPVRIFLNGVEVITVYTTGLFAHYMWKLGKLSAGVHIILCRYDGE